MHSFGMEPFHPSPFHVRSLSAQDSLRTHIKELLFLLWILQRATTLSVSKKSAYGVLFRELNAVSLSSLRDSRAGNSARCVEKVRLRRPFPRVERCFPLVPAGLPGGKQRKETLQGKASASAAHVAGCGLHLEGFGPPNLPEGFFDSLSLAMQGPNPPRMSPDSDCIWRAAALQTAQRGFLTVWGVVFTPLCEF